MTYPTKQPIESFEAMAVKNRLDLEHTIAENGGRLSETTRTLVEIYKLRYRELTGNEYIYVHKSKPFEYAD